LSYRRRLAGAGVPVPAPWRSCRRLDSPCLAGGQAEIPSVGLFPGGSDGGEPPVLSPNSENLEPRCRHLAALRSLR